jgi:hypothetical protein
MMAFFHVMGIKYYIVYPGTIDGFGDVSKTGQLIIRPVLEDAGLKFEMTSVETTIKWFAQS